MKLHVKAMEIQSSTLFSNKERVYETRGSVSMRIPCLIGIGFSQCTI